MKVGTICKLKVGCLGNKAGTLGVVFNDYGDGFQAIFENGNYDGFSNKPFRPAPVPSQAQTEADHFLEEVGFEVSLAGYKFQNVRTVSEDYRQGKFDRAWSVFWQKAAEQIEQAEAKATEYEKCEVYADGNRPPWLRFKRRIGPKGTKDSVQCCMLSAAMDYVDFSHFEYACGERLAPRLLHGDVTICPLYVVFRKKL